MTTDLPAGQRKRKDAILEEATRLFAERGYSACSMADLAECVGLRKASLFHHFPSKDDLYSAVLERLVRALSENLISAATPVVEFDERLDRMTDAMVAAFGEQPFAAKIVTREMMDWGPFVQARFADLIAPVLETAAAFLRAGMDAGAFRRQDVDQVVITLIGIHVMPFAIGDMVHGMLHMDAASPEFVGLRREALRTQVRALVLSAPN